MTVLAVVNPGEQQQIAVEARKAGGHLIEALHRLSLVLRKVRRLQKHVKLALEYGKRGLKLMGGIFRELLLHPVARKAVLHQGGQGIVQP